ncbi:MAG: hypothetical protein EOP05_14305, partial [Proteobacteria bacterium]
MRLRNYAFAVIALVALAFIYGFAVEPYWIEYTAHKIEMPVKRSYTVLQLSDLHLRDFGQREREIIKHTEETKPDIIALTGDLVSSEPHADEIARFVKQLRSNLGVFVIMGNWEHWRPSELIPKLESIPDVHVLINSSFQIAEDLTIIGMDDDLAGKPNEELAFAAVDNKSARLLLFHSPIAFAMVKKPYDLVLA